MGNSLCIQTAQIFRFIIRLNTNTYRLYICHTVEYKKTRKTAEVALHFDIHLSITLH